MEQWSRNVINYEQYDKHPKNFHTMSVRPINKTKIRLKGKGEYKEKPILEIDFRNTSDRLKEEYLDRYEGVKSERLSTTKFDENSDLSMTYLGKTNIVKKNKIKAKRNIQYQKKGIQQESYWTVLNIRYYRILELANPSCPYHNICIANLFSCYLCLPQRLRGSK